MTRTRFYAVACGRARGLYSTWQQCAQQVMGWPGAVYKSFPTLQDARAFLQAHPETNSNSNNNNSNSNDSNMSSKRSDGDKSNNSSSSSGCCWPSAVPMCRVAAATQSEAQSPLCGQSATVTRKRLRNEDEEAAACTTRTQAATLPSPPPPTTTTTTTMSTTGAAIASAVTTREEAAAAAVMQRACDVTVQEVYVDGACRSNGKGTHVARAGYGGYYGSTRDERNFALAVPRHEAQTNNRAELYAVLHAVQQGFVDAGMRRARLVRGGGSGQRDNNVHDGDAVAVDVPRACDLTRPLRPLRIYTDSRYVVKGLTEYSVRWRRNGFVLTDKTPVLNQDLWRRLLALYDTYNSIYAAQQQQQQQQEQRSRGCVGKEAYTVTTTTPRIGIDIQHVRGHANVPGNVQADLLAVRGALLSD